MNNPNLCGKVFSWLTGKNQKPTSITSAAGGGVLTVARHGNSDGGGGVAVSVRMYDSHGNLLEPDADLNF